MGGVDAIVFAGGIGEHDARSRGEIAGWAGGLGDFELDCGLNGKGEGVRLLSKHLDQHVAVYVVPAEEDRMIAMHVDRYDGRAELVDFGYTVRLHLT